jgi:starch-binding outer membrane protein, SusD/RagB family
MTNPMPFLRYSGRARVLTALVGALGLAACDSEKLLTAPTPDVVLPENLSGPGALASAYAAVVGDFQVAYAGGYGALLDYNEGLVQTTGLLTDELLNAETYNTRIDIDRRAINAINGTTLQIFQNVQRSRASADLVASRFRQFLPADPRGAEVQALAAYMYVMLAESYCNGVPTSRVNDDGTFTYSPGQTGTQLLATAVAKFDSAIVVATAAGTSGSRALNLARIGKGRALLDLGQFANAAAAVAAVPDAYEYVIEHSENSSRQNNAIYTFNYLENRFSVPEREGGNGIAFRTLNDPRNPLIDYGIGFDESTEQFLPTKYLERTSPTPLATGVEARLIEAEAALQATNPTTFVAKLNAARAAARTYPTTEDPTDPPAPSPAAITLATVGATPTAQQNFLFQERALSLFLTNHRIGDLRRLVYQYGRGAETVFPTGEYQASNPDKSGTPYGTDVNLPIPQEEANNPLFGGSCINRVADIK